MSMLANILGFSAFGLAARLGQLGIQHRPLLDNPLGHVASTAIFGYLGYLSFQFDERHAELFAKRRLQVAEAETARREKLERLHAELQAANSSAAH